MKMLLALFITMILSTSCQPEKATRPAHLPAENQFNVSYGKDSLQKMDIYLPAGRTVNNTKAIILIHGGGWNGGNKSDFKGYIDSLKKRIPDYAIFNINYRLVNNGHLFPRQEEDVKKALDFISEQSAAFAVNKNQMAIVGASAGGHLALLQAYKHQHPGVKAVIDFFGPTDLVHMYRNPWHPLVPFALQSITGSTPERNSAIYRESSPAYYVRPNSTPTLIFHGEKDHIVHISQSRLLKKKLEQAGVPHELVVYPHERHGWYGSALSSSFDKMKDFLAVHLP